MNISSQREMKELNYKNDIDNYLNSGSFQKALDYCNMAISEGFTSSKIYERRADAHVQLKMYSNALKDYQEASKADPSDDWYKEKITKLKNMGF